MNDLERLLIDADEGSDEALKAAVRYLERRGFKGRILRLLSNDVGHRNLPSEMILWYIYRGDLEGVRQYLTEPKKSLDQECIRALQEYVSKGSWVYIEIARELMPHVTNEVTVQAFLSLAGAEDRVDYVEEILFGQILYRGFQSPDRLKGLIRHAFLKACGEEKALKVRAALVDHISRDRTPNKYYMEALGRRCPEGFKFLLENGFRWKGMPYQFGDPKVLEKGEKGREILRLAEDYRVRRAQGHRDKYKVKGV